MIKKERRVCTLPWHMSYIKAIDCQKSQFYSAKMVPMVVVNWIVRFEH
jgi:hypothetical protein